MTTTEFVVFHVYELFLCVLRMSHVCTIFAMFLIRVCWQFMIYDTIQVLHLLGMCETHESTTTTKLNSLMALQKLDVHIHVYPTFVHVLYLYTCRVVHIHV